MNQEKQAENPIERTKVFAVADPRTFDGNPYEVAERAARQAASLASLAKQATEAARVMIRNAEMERQIVFDGEPDAQAFEESVHAKKVDGVIEDLTASEKTMNMLATAAGFNPKARIGRSA